MAGVTDGTRATSMHAPATSACSKWWVASTPACSTVDVSGTGIGDYTYQLNDNVAHDLTTTNNSLTQAIAYQTNNGSGNVQVTIVDDRPQAFDRTVEVTEDALPSYNLVLVLDVSGA